MKAKRIPPFWLVLLGSLSVLATSCTTAHKLSYFNDLPDAEVVPLPASHPVARKVETGDRLVINIDARDKDAAGFFNRKPATGAAAPTGSGSGTAETGYLVDSQGRIDMPVLGKIAVVGYTTERLKDSLTAWVSPYLKDPLVVVGFSSFRITVLGEVRSPGTYSLNMQRTTILQALAAAGDLPHSAKRHNVSLYRDYGGHRSITRIDLRNSSLLNNPNTFQLKPNDVLYVRPRNGSIFAEDFSVLASIVTIAVSVVTLAITLSR